MLLACSVTSAIARRCAPILADGVGRRSCSTSPPRRSCAAASPIRSAPSTSTSPAPRSCWPRQRPRRSVRTVLVGDQRQGLRQRRRRSTLRRERPAGWRRPVQRVEGGRRAVVSSWRHSFATADGTRAGHGAGRQRHRWRRPWLRDRLIPDLFRSLAADQPLVRAPSRRRVRPWQFVLEPLVGYLGLRPSRWRRRRRRRRPRSTSVRSWRAAGRSRALADGLIERCGDGIVEPVERDRRARGDAAAPRRVAGRAVARLAAAARSGDGARLDRRLVAGRARRRRLAELRARARSPATRSGSA